MEVGKECLSETSRPGFISSVRPVEGLVHELCFRGLYMNFSMEGLLHELCFRGFSCLQAGYQDGRDLLLPRPRRSLQDELFQKKKNKFERIPANHLSEKQNAIKAFTAEGFWRNGQGRFSLR